MTALYTQGVIISPIIIICVVISFMGVIVIIGVTMSVEKKHKVSSSIQAVHEMKKLWVKENPGDELEIIDGAWRKRFVYDKNYVGARFKRLRTEKIIVLIYCIEEHDIVDADMTPRPSKISDVFCGFNPGMRGQQGGFGGHHDRYDNYRYQQPYRGSHNYGYNQQPPQQSSQPQSNSSLNDGEKKVIK